MSRRHEVGMARTGRTAGTARRAWHPKQSKQLKQSNRSKPLVGAVAVAASLLFTVGACGSTSTAAPNAAAQTGSGLPSPAGASVYSNAPASSGAAPADDSCNAVASLRPSGPLPTPGEMPAGSTMAAIQARGYLTVGVDQDSYLFGYRNPAPAAGQPPVVGFDIDVLHRVAQAIFGDPNRIHYQLISQAQRITAITSGQVDLVADSMTINCDREKQVDFSTDYFDAGQRLLVSTASTAQDVQGLAGKKVCAAAGTTSIQTLADPKYHLIPIAAANWSDCLVMLQQGQVDAVSTDDSILAGLALQDPYSKVVGPRFTQEPHGIAVSQKSPDLVRFVNAVLDQMRTDGSWTALYNKWIGAALGPVPAPPPATYKD